MNEINYRQEYEALHARGFFGGNSCLYQKTGIYEIVKKTNSKFLLDYGSGKGKQYSIHKLDEYWGVTVECYDPYVKEFSTLPDKTYDGVVCTDVLEHIPEENLDLVLNNIFSRATKFVYFCIHVGKATKKFSNGENVHVTIRPPEYWKDKIQQYNKNNLLFEITFRTK